MNELYGAKVDLSQVQLQITRKEFEGDYTLVVFPLVKVSKKSPEITATEIGDYLCNIQRVAEKYNIVKGFLNFVITSYSIHYTKLYEFQIYRTCNFEIKFHRYGAFF